MSIALLLGSVGTQAGGLETYEINLVRALAAVDQTTAYHVICLGERATERLSVNQPNFRLTQLPSAIRPMNVAMVVPAMLLVSRAALLHPTYIPPTYSPLPYVYTAHSSVTWVHPEFYPRLIRWRLNYLQEKGIAEARIVLCVSEHVRDYVREHFRVHPDRLAVVYHGVSPDFQPRGRPAVEQHLKKFGLEFPYLIYVGKLTENKNISRLINAFRIARRTIDPTIPLVLAGRRLWSEGELDQELDHAVADGIVVELGHLAHEDMPPLYNGALGLVFPSLWEGFGLPILEAFASGIPVLTSNNSALPEVARENAIYVKPNNTEEIAQGIVNLVTDSDLRQRLVEGGLRRVQDFSWRATAEQTIAAHSRALEL